MCVWWMLAACKQDTSTCNSGLHVTLSSAKQNAIIAVHLGNIGKQG